MITEKSFVSQGLRKFFQQAQTFRCAFTRSPHCGTTRTHRWLCKTSELEGHRRLDERKSAFCTEAFVAYHSPESSTTASKNTGHGMKAMYPDIYFGVYRQLSLPKATVVLRTEIQSSSKDWNLHTRFITRFIKVQQQQ